jgi:hypothetical protein
MLGGVFTPMRRLHSYGFIVAREALLTPAVIRMVDRLPGPGGRAALVLVAFIVRWICWWGGPWRPLLQCLVVLRELRVACAAAVVVDRLLGPEGPAPLVFLAFIVRWPPSPPPETTTSTSTPRWRPACSSGSPARTWSLRPSPWPDRR